MKTKPLYIVDFPTQSDTEFWLLLLLYRRQRPAEPKEMYDLLAEHFKLTARQRQASMQYTEENAWHNRVRQARRHLVNLGWIDLPSCGNKRGFWNLTKEGQTVAEKREWLIDPNNGF
jgi:hypothetical protein